MTHKLVLWFLSAAVLNVTIPIIACDDGGDGDGDADGDADGDGDGDADGDADGDPPAAPDVDDDAYTVTSEATWLMVGDGLTPPDDFYVATIEVPDGVDEIAAWLDETGPISATVDEGVATVELSVGERGPGEYQVVFALPGAEVGFAARTFIRTHALYVIMACDWDDADNDDAYLENMDLLRENHPGLRYTQYLGPYTFTDDGLDDTRRQELVDYVLAGADEYGDEIGVHIHPYCSFVEHAGLTCQTQPSLVYDEGDASGFTVIFSSYTQEQQTTLLTTAADLFEDWGLGRPTSFRAGGWSGDESTALALEAAGYTMQADAFPGDRVEEWEGIGNGVFYEWLLEHWGTIGSLSQPYYPTIDDIELPATSADNAVPVLQVPANGVIADYVTSEELIEIFFENWSEEGPLEEPTIFHSGLHPTNFARFTHYRTLHDGLSGSVDLALYANDEGPALYATAGEMTLVYPYEF